MQTNKNYAHGRRRKRFDEIVAVHYADMYRYAAWLSRDSGIAEDIVQEAMLRAWNAFESLRDDALAKPWLLTIVRRENARYFERKRIETVDIDNLTDAQSAVLSQTDDPKLDALRAGIYALELQHREPLILQVMMGYTTSEIAELLRIRQGAVLTRLHRARNKLRNILDVENADPVERSERPRSIGQLALAFR